MPKVAKRVHTGDKTEYVGFKIDAKLKKKLQRQANRAKLSPSDYLRNLIQTEDQK